jgi:hypothetical protein
MKNMSAPVPGNLMICYSCNKRRQKNIIYNRAGEKNLNTKIAPLIGVPKTDAQAALMRISRFFFGRRHKMSRIPASVEANPAPNLCARPSFPAEPPKRKRIIVAMNFTDDVRF